MGFEDFLSEIIVEYYRKFTENLNTFDIIYELKLFYQIGYTPQQVVEIIVSEVNYEE